MMKGRRNGRKTHSFNIPLFSIAAKVFFMFCAGNSTKPLNKLGQEPGEAPERKCDCKVHKYREMIFTLFFQINSIFTVPKFSKTERDKKEEAYDTYYPGI